MEKHINKPILITGCIRSGTTFVGRILNYSNQVLYLWEPFQVGLKSLRKDGVFDYWFEYLDIDSPKTRIVSDYLYSYRKLNPDDIKKLKTKRFNKFLFEQKNILRKLSLLFFQNRYRLLFKDPIAIFSTDWFSHNFNDVKIVIMMRNPVSFAESIVRLNWDINFKEINEQPKLLAILPEDMRKDIKLYSHNDSIDLISKSILFWKIIHFYILKLQENRKDWLFVKIEEIEQNPIKKFNEIFNYCNLLINKKTQRQISKIQITSNNKWIKNSSISQNQNNILSTLEKTRIKKETFEIARTLGY